MANNILIIDKRHAITQKTPIPIPSSFEEAFALLENKLTMLISPNPRRDTEIRDRSGKEKTFYDYPPQTFRIALSIFLKWRNQAKEAPANNITITPGWINFHPLSPNNNGQPWYEVEQEAVKQIRKELTDNLYRIDNVEEITVLETGREYLTIFHRNYHKKQQQDAQISQKYSNIKYKDIPQTVFVPGGNFWMGSNDDDPIAHDNEKPRFSVYLPDYEIGRFPVTNAQYARFIHSNSDPSSPGHWGNNSNTPPTWLMDHPVVNVNWEDAANYCRWLSRETGQLFQLPSEEQWEKAARGNQPDIRQYTWGNERLDNYCNTKELSRNYTSSVAEFEQISRSPFGTVDMLGNTWEWTDSWYDRYPNSLRPGLHYGREYKVVRGGSWKHSFREARISCRGRRKKDIKRSYLGFRVIKMMPSPPVPISLDKLRKKMYTQLDDEDLRSLCIYFDINYDKLPGENIVAKVQGIINYAERNDLLNPIAEKCRQLYPNVW